MRPLVLHMAERQRALFAPGHQAAGDSDFLPVVLLELRNQLTGIMSASALGGERVQSEIAQRLSLADADVANFS